MFSVMDFGWGGRYKIKVSSAFFAKSEFCGTVATTGGEGVRIQQESPIDEYAYRIPIPSLSAPKVKVPSTQDKHRIS